MGRKPVATKNYQEVSRIVLNTSLMIRDVSCALCAKGREVSKIVLTRFTTLVFC